MGSRIARNHLSGLSGLPRCPCGRYAEGATRHTSGLVAQWKYRLTLRSALCLRLLPHTTGELNSFSRKLNMSEALPPSLGRSWLKFVQKS